MVLKRDFKNNVGRPRKKEEFKAKKTLKVTVEVYKFIESLGAGETVDTTLRKSFGLPLINPEESKLKPEIVIA